MLSRVSVNRSRVSKLMGLPHISAGDLVRDEIKRGSPLAAEMAEVTKAGRLLPDQMVLTLLQQRLAAGSAAGERGCMLDGFPRTLAQAQLLDASGIAVTHAVNFHLREDVLVQKCCGRRVCGECNKSFNLAEINYPATADQPAIYMPPLMPSKCPRGSQQECLPKMQTREDDTEEVVRKRLAVYKEQCGPVEEFYRQRGVLTDFAITAGIPETMPPLLEQLLRLLGQRK